MFLLFYFILSLTCCIVWLCCLHATIPIHIVKYFRLNRDIKSWSSICDRTENPRYSSHYRIIKYVDFVPIIYVINLDVALLYKVFSEFNSIFL